MQRNLHALCMNGAVIHVFKQRDLRDNAARNRQANERKLGVRLQHA
jgi:hypothetical protein